MEIATALAGLAIGLLLGAAAAWLIASPRHAAASTEASMLRRQDRDLAARAESARRDASAARADLAAAQAELRIRTSRRRSTGSGCSPAATPSCARRSARCPPTRWPATTRRFVQLAEAKLREATATLAQKADGDACSTSRRSRR
jgi:hypothetical protein